jgi:hypothetical protein
MDPLEIALINSAKPPKPFDPLSTTGKKVILNGVSQHFLNQLRITHKTHLILIENQLRNLSGYYIQHNGYYKAGNVKGLLPSSTNSQSVKPQKVAYRNGLQKINVSKYEIIYAIGNMQIDIQSIDFNENSQVLNAKKEKPAMYRVKRNDEGLWKITLNRVKNIETKYAAVNGQSNNLKKATWLMGRYLEHHYGKSEVNEYTLFHNPSEGGKRDTWESSRDKLGGINNTYYKVI